MKIPVALSIAGVDPSGGAGIFADIKVFSILGVYGTGVITSITSQNTYELNQIKYLDRKFFKKQLYTLLKDIKPDSVKIGMIANADLIDTIRQSFIEYSIKKIVLDTVMISKQGRIIGSKKLVKKIVSELLPLADIITPNIPEASFISGINIKNKVDILKAAEIICAKGAKNVLIKGGHLEGFWSLDFFFDGNKMRVFKNKRIKTKNTHGSGCVLSSAISSFMAKGFSPEVSVKKAIRFVNISIKNSLDIGRGFGPVNVLIKQEVKDEN